MDNNHTLKVIQISSTSWDTFFHCSAMSWLSQEPTEHLLNKDFNLLDLISHLRIACYLCFKSSLGVRSFGVIRIRSLIQDHSDHGASKELTNPLWSRIHRSFWRVMIRVILDHWSGSGGPQRNSPLVYNLSHSNELFLHVHCFANQTHFHMTGCTPGLVFKQVKSNSEKDYCPNLEDKRLTLPSRFSRKEIMKKRGMLGRKRDYVWDSSISLTFP